MQANVTVWRRFGSRGDILVTGVASTVTQVGTNQSPAQAVVDFPTTPVTTVINDGMTSGTISIQLRDNNDIGSPKVFQFNLTSVERVPAVQSKMISFLDILCMLFCRSSLFSTTSFQHAQ